MPSLFLAVALFLPAMAVWPQKDPFGSAKCRQAQTAAATTPSVVRPHRLGELPPAERYKAVWREVDGCPTPVKVRESRSATPRR